MPRDVPCSASQRYVRCRSFVSLLFWRGAVPDEKMEFILEKIHWLGMRIFAQKRGKIICTFAAVFFFGGKRGYFVVHLAPISCSTQVWVSDDWYVDPFHPILMSLMSSWRSWTWTHFWRSSLMAFGFTQPPHQAPQGSWRHHRLLKGHRLGLTSTLCWRSGGQWTYGLWSRTTLTGLGNCQAIDQGDSLCQTLGWWGAEPVVGWEMFCVFFWGVVGGD